MRRRPRNNRGDCIAGAASISTLPRRTFLAGVGAASVIRPAGAAVRYDVCVYGATPSGIAAAYAASREGARVVLVYGPNAFGGMCTNGLGHTDHDTELVIGGFAASFLKQASKRSGLPPGDIDFLPNAADEIFRAMLRTAGVQLVPTGLVAAVARDGTKLTAIKLDTGDSVAAAVFIDASYEGDLLKLSALWTQGREAVAHYGETGAGWGQVMDYHRVVTHHNGRMIFGVSDYPSGLKIGDADHRTEAYSFRLCLSDDPANRRSWAAPPGYDPDEFLLDLSRIGKDEVFAPALIDDHHFDFKTIVLGLSRGYPRGDASTRQRLWQAHYRHQAGALYFMATDPRVPASYRESVNQYGLAKDQFVDTGNWPRQLYIRECIRLVGAQVLKQQDTQEQIVKPDSIGMGAYGLDCHFTGAYALSDDMTVLEGSIAKHAGALTAPYQIPYGILHAHPAHCRNLLVSVCVSASHVGFSSLRIETTYMAMGEAAGIAAAISMGDATRVEVSAVQNRLRSWGAVLEL